MKERLIALVIIVAVWMGLDYLFHGVLLHADYAATAQLWRPMADMKNGLMMLASVFQALVFVLIYCQMVPEKNQSKGIKLGLLVGLLVGAGMGSSYAWMPITGKIASVWFISGVVYYTIAGAITGKIVKSNI